MKITKGENERRDGEGVVSLSFPSLCPRPFPYRSAIVRTETDRMSENKRALSQTVRYNDQTAENISIAMTDFFYWKITVSWIEN